MVALNKQLMDSNYWTGRGKGRKTEKKERGAQISERIIIRKECESISELLIKINHKCSDHILSFQKKSERKKHRNRDNCALYIIQELWDNFKVFSFYRFLLTQNSFTFATIHYGCTHAQLHNNTKVTKIIEYFIVVGERVCVLLDSTIR